MSTRDHRWADPEEGAWEVAQLWTAPNADALHRVLVTHAPIRGSADAFEPFALLSKHHESEPETSLVTATLLLTDRRWRHGVGQLVRRIAESDILSADELDFLAETFLAAGGAVYWQAPDDWFGEDSFEIALDVSADGADEAPGDDDQPTDVVVGPTVARRDVYPPLRRWAAARALSRAPESWAGLIARAKEIDARSGAAIVCGVLDSIDAPPPAAQRLLIDIGITWPDHAVRLLALGLLADRDGVEAAHRVAQHDSSARVRDWAAKLITARRPDDRESTTHTTEPGQAPPTLF